MIPRFHCARPLAAPGVVELPAQAAHHALRVLRLVRGDAVVLFNGEGGEYSGRIVEANRAVRVEIDAWHDTERESPLRTTLAQALPAGDKMDWIVQKAVELGACAIAPLAAARSVVRLTGERAVRRTEHWRQVAVSACEQCGRNRVPQVLPPADLRQWLARLGPPGNEIRLLLAPRAGQRLRELRPQGGVILLIGPEGGLTEEEEAGARACGFQGVALGPRILRTETAGPAALAALAALHGDF